MEIDKYKIIKTSRSSHPYVTGIKQSRHLQECFSTRSYGNLRQTQTITSANVYWKTPKLFFHIIIFDFFKSKFSTYGKDESTRQSRLVGFLLHRREKRQKKYYGN